MSVNEQLCTVISNSSFKDASPEERYSTLMNVFHEHSDAFVSFHRLSRPQFDFLLYLIGTNLDGLPHSASLCLSLTLRHLSHDVNCIVPISVLGVRSSIIPSILDKVFQVIIDVLTPKHFRKLTDEDLKEIADDFHKLWNFPHCIGALECRRIICQIFTDSGPKTVSAQVGFICDPYFQFSGVYICDPLKKRRRESLTQYKLRPNTSISRFQDGFFLENRNDNYVTIGSTESNLIENNLRPYYECPIRTKRIFNRHMQRVHSVVEDALGILFSQWNIFKVPIHIKEGTLERILGCTVLLHNWLIAEDILLYNKNRNYAPKGFFVTFDNFHQLQPANQPLPSITSGVRQLENYLRVTTPQGLLRRDEFAEYFYATAPEGQHSSDDPESEREEHDTSETNKPKDETKTTEKEEYLPRSPVPELQEHTTSQNNKQTKHRKGKVTSQHHRIRNKLDTHQRKT